jgi:1-acyl-sn-glycerol-3-phosphate acyltransferase
MRKAFGKFMLWLWGWKVTGYLPVEVPKAIFVVVPHTSWVDVPIGFFVRMIIQKKVRFLAKHTLFKFPYGWFLRWLGGYPVDRTQRNNLVDAVAEIYNTHDTFYLAITPEGTRKKVHRLRSGFYYMSLAAGVPMILSQFNYKDKKVHFSDPYFPSGNKEKDFEEICTYFSGIQGRIPEYSFDYHEKPEEQ